MELILKDLVSNIKESIPGYIGVSVTDMSSGESLVSDSVLEGFDTELASAFNVEIINAIRKTMNFTYLALNKDKANIGITKKLLAKYMESLNNEL